ncbi:IclR family transcriptional regulator [Streptomyces chryseus]
MQNKPPYAITSVDSALRLLLLLQRRHPLRTSEAAQALGVAPSTAHRLLAMLRFRGFVTQGSDKAYIPGPVFYDIGLSPRRGRNVREAARPHLERLNSAVNETVHLMSRTGTQVTFLDSVEANQALRIGSRIGASMPAHRTSGGKALLAELSLTGISALYREGLPQDLPFQSEGIQGFYRALTSVRQCGYGLNVGESESGVTAVGMSVRDSNGQAVAAIAVSAPTLRLSRSRVPEIAESLSQTVRQLEIDLNI